MSFSELKSPFFISILAAECLVSLGASANPDDSDLIEQIVVTGTRTERKLEDSPVPVSVMTKEQLDMFSGGTVAETLDFMSGVVVKKSVKDGVNVFMQGFDSSRVAILVDGMPLISPTDESVDLDQISALDIERVEVIRGASSVLYGSSAMGGVINIITANPEGNSFYAAYELSRLTELRDPDYEDANKTNIAGSVAKSGWYGQLTFQDSYDPGFDYYPQSVARDSGEVDKKFTKLRAGKRVGDVNIHLANQWFEENKYKITGPFSGGGRDYYLSEVEQNQFDFSLLYGELWKMQLRNTQHDEVSGQRGSLRETEIENTDIDAQHVFEFTESSVVAGLHYYDESMYQVKQDGTVEVDHVARDGVEVFVQSDWQITENLELLGGARAQDDSSFGGHSALRINSKWMFPLSDDSSLNWRTTIGEGYRVPNLKERFYDFDHTNLGYIVQGNETLVPETSVSANTSLEYLFQKNSNLHVSVELSAHISNVDNLITSVRDDEESTPSLDVYRYQNIDEVEISGGDFNFKVVQPNQRFQIGYSYVVAENKLTKRRLTERPYHQIKANYQRNFEWMESRFLIYALYELDEAYTQESAIADDYVSLNLTYALTLYKNLSLRLGVENLLDEHREPNLNTGTTFDPRPVTARYVFTQLKFKL
ncbi:Vitamin B12 transporter BtuB [Thalassocella blandensis]|nr:Vitamin B12 transporter BtuB [Thalassocella blandensis]